MKQIKRYVCETCGTEFADVVRCRYNSIRVNVTGYPQTITVKMTDGEEILYKR